MIESNVDVVPADHDGVVAAVAALRAGGCIALPTDTVYGVAAALSDPVAVQRLFALKGRAATKAMAVLVGSFGQARELGEFGELSTRLVQRYWPGPLTVVVRRAKGLDIDLGGDSSTIGIRCPDSSLVSAITDEVGPIVTTSANRSGARELATAVEIAEAFGEHLALVIDGGKLSGTPSTVVDLCGTGIDILREGPILSSDLLRF